jgi:O-antigen/teichoic acid export membrane protein
MRAVGPGLSVSSRDSQKAHKKIGDRLLFATATGWGYRGVAILCNLANISLLFRYLNKELLGLWFLMLGAQAFMGLFDFGFGQTLQRRIAYRKAACGASPDVALDERAKEDIRGLLSLASRIYAFTSIAVFFVVLVAGWVYFHSLKISPGLADDLRVAWLIMSLGYAVNTLGFMVESSLNGLGDIGWSNLVNSGAQVATLISNWLVLSMGLGLNGLAVIWLLKGFAIRLVGWAIVTVRHRWVSLRGKPSGVEILCNMVPPSLRWWLALVGSFLMTGIGQYLIAKFLGAASLPDYAATYAALAAAQGAMVGVVTAGTPIFSQLLKAGETAHVKDTVLLLTRYSLGGLVAAFGILVVWGKEALEVWLGKGHFVGYATFGVLMVLMIAEAHQGMFQSACVAAEKLGFYKAVLVGGVLSLGLCLILIPRFGILGAAVSALIGQGATQHWVIPWLAMRALQMRFLEDLKRVLLPAACLGGAITLAGLVFKTLCGSPFPALIATFFFALLSGYVFFRKLIEILLRKIEFRLAP